MSVKNSVNQYSDARQLEAVNLYKTGLSAIKVAKKLDVSPGFVLDNLHKRNIPIHHHPKRKYNVNDFFFQKIDTQEKAYWLGFLYADGCVFGENLVKLSIAEEDRDHLKKFKKVIQAENPIQVQKTKNPKWQNMYTLAISSGEMVENLKKLGCINNKTFLLKWPTEKQVPKKLLNHFIRGYFDGDGCFYFSMNSELRGRIFITSTLEICKGICQSLNVNCSLKQRFPERKNNNWSLTISGNKQCLKALNYLYQNSKIFLLRKNEKFKLFKSLYANLSL